MTRTTSRERYPLHLDLNQQRKDRSPLFFGGDIRSLAKRGSLKQGLLIHNHRRECGGTKKKKMPQSHYENAEKEEGLGGGASCSCSFDVKEKGRKEDSLWA